MQIILKQLLRFLNSSYITRFIVNELNLLAIIYERYLFVKIYSKKKDRSKILKDNECYSLYYQYVLLYYLYILIYMWYNLSRYHKIMTLLKLWFTKFDVSILLFDIIYLSMNKIK